MLGSFSIPYIPKRTMPPGMIPNHPALPLPLEPGIDDYESVKETRTRALEQSFLVLKLHLMRLADGEDAFSAFCNVQNQIVHDVQEIQLPDPAPMQPFVGPFAHTRNYMKIPQLPGNTQFTQLPGNNSVVCLQTTNQAVDPNRFCFLCKFAQALLGTWVCSGCMGKCWSCEKTDGTLRFGLYWTCDECEKNKKCLFCELENADLFHYGAPVCETCKGRFRSYNGLKAGGRTSQPKPCDKGGICANLSACTGCWAAKCLPVWKDIYDQWKSQNGGRKQKRLRSMPKEQATVGETAAASLIKGLVKNVESYDAERPIEILNHVDIIRQRIEFLKGLIRERPPLDQDLLDLDQQDKEILLQQTSNEISLLRFALQQTRIRQSNQINQSNFFSVANDEMSQFVRSLEELKVGLEEFELLTAIVLFSPDHRGLTKPTLVQTKQKRFVDALQEKFGNERTITLVLKLCTLRKLAQNHVTTCYEQYLDDQYNINNNDHLIFGPGSTEQWNTFN